jgi:hypothetical protein
MRCRWCSRAPRAKSMQTRAIVSVTDSDAPYSSEVSSSAPATRCWRIPTERWARARSCSIRDTRDALQTCVDRTWARTEPYLKGPHRLEDVSYANVGRARAHGAQLALRHFADRDLSHVWLATTDADSRVSPRWLAEHVAIANTGVDALAEPTATCTGPTSAFGQTHTSRWAGLQSSPRVKITRCGMRSREAASGWHPSGRSS